MTVLCAVEFALIGAAVAMTIILICGVTAFKSERVFNYTSILIMISFLLIGGIYGYTLHDYDVTYEISSIEDLSGIHGSFVLGSGTIDSTAMFAYYRKVPDGAYKLEMIPSRQSLIYEDTIKSYVVRHCIACSGGDFYGDIYDIHVPEGTIIKQFTLNGVSQWPKSGYAHIAGMKTKTQIE